jgi:hypothetical protein
MRVKFVEAIQTWPLTPTLTKALETRDSTEPAIRVDVKALEAEVDRKSRPIEVKTFEC